MNLENEIFIYKTPEAYEVYLYNNNIPQLTNTETFFHLRTYNNQKHAHTFAQEISQELKVHYQNETIQNNTKLS